MNILPSIKMKMILLIDDNLQIRENFTEFLEMSGYKIILAENGESGIELAKLFLPDLIICDVLMPGMNGYEVLRIVLNTPELLGIPFIFSTSNSENVDQKEAMHLGANDYIVKPFEMESLIKKIEKSINFKNKIHQLN